MKFLIVFAYCKRARIFDENLMFFLQNAVFESALYNFYIVISGDSNIIAEVKNIENKFSNVKILYRENRFGDFGAWGYALRAVDLTMYEKFIFLNDTCRGPYVQGTCSLDMWPKIFLSNVNERCKLVGPTKNNMIADHIQSYAFGCDKLALDLLIGNDIFNPTIEYHARKQEFIVKHEVGMSQIILRNNYHIEAFFKGDGNSPYYLPIILSPFEIMFIKTNIQIRIDRRQLYSALPSFNPLQFKKTAITTEKNETERKLIVARKYLKK